MLADVTSGVKIDFIEVDYEAYQENWLEINGRDWLPTDEEMKSYLAQQAIEDDLIDIDDFMLEGLPNTNYQPIGEVGGLVSGIDY